MTPNATELRVIPRYARLGMALWTLLCLLSLAAFYHTESHQLENTLLSLARIAFEKDLVYRRWAAQHGGVYAPVTEKTVPNPNLSVPERDITTPSGRHLTLINPAYMTRQVHELSTESRDGPQGHITSLKPIRPENQPSDWEREALLSFEKGEQEYARLASIEGYRVYRFMRPMKTEKTCLKCHESQGYREGDLRGGISVTLSAEKLVAEYEEDLWKVILTLFFVWLAGMTGITAASRRVQSSARHLGEERNRAIENEKRFRSLFEATMAVMLIVDPDTGAIVDANPAACRFYGYAAADLQQMHIRVINMLPPDELKQLLLDIKSESKARFTVPHRLKDGSLRTVEVMSSPVEYRGRVCLYSIIFDISDRIAAEKLVEEQKLFAENLIQNLPIPTFVIGRDRKVLIWNRALAELTGYEAEVMLGSTEHWRAFRHEQQTCLACTILAAAETDTTQSPEILESEGEYLINGVNRRLTFAAAPILNREGDVIGAVESMQDVTRIFELQEQLAQSQKLESIGLLAGGIAHDFNNVLTVIAGYANLLQTSLENSGEAKHFADEIAASVSRAAEMTRSLLTFSGRHVIERNRYDLNEILDTVKKSLTRLIREDISLSIEPSADPLPVHVDRVQIEQIIINLVVNARDAIRGNGTIRVVTSHCHLDKPQMKRDVALLPGEYATIAVSDTGSGIDGESLKRIFEPFFTTKDKGKGTGLGLSIVKTILSRHDGDVLVSSSPDSGTEFTVYLPLAKNGAQPASTAIHEAEELNGEGTILLAEDDPQIRGLLSKMLERYGYRVVCAEDGTLGLAAFKEESDTIDLIISDMIMPRMNGREMVTQIRQLNPRLPVIMVSGYADDLVKKDELTAMQVEFLDKPVKPLALLSLIKKLLGEVKNPA